MTAVTYAVIFCWKQHCRLCVKVSNYTWILITTSSQLM